MMRQRFLLLCGIFFITHPSIADDLGDSIPHTEHYIHQLAAEVRQAYILPTSPFLKGENEKSRALRSAFSTHLRYAFKFSPSSLVDQIYGSPHQGIGVAYYNFGDYREIGNPLSVYLLQGGQLSEFDSRLSLNYEWNFGLSGGWHPYDVDHNPNNIIIGSKLNAYLHTSLYLNYALSREFDLTAGIALTHFSNGNTQFPNAGLNTIGLTQIAANHR